MLTGTTRTISAGLLALCVAQAHAVMPNEITLTNETDLTLGTSVAGLPGNDILPHASRPVAYSIVMMGCNFANAITNCPIEFFDRTTGDVVASVRLNANEVKLNEAPVFYGNYGDLYEVTGWEGDSVSNITIANKAD